jgi:HK97 family phage prohead protease
MIKTKYIHCQLAKIEVKSDLPEQYPNGYIEGYASVFGNVDNGREVVVKGAFAKTLRERLKRGMIKLMDNHQFYSGTDPVVGLVTEAKEDEYGLWFRAKLSAVQKAQDIRVKVSEGILNALSFGYDVIQYEVDESKKTRKLLELRLHEISVVIWGMNSQALITEAKGANGETEPSGFAQGFELDEVEIKGDPVDPPVVEPPVDPPVNPPVVDPPADPPVDPPVVEPPVVDPPLEEKDEKKALGEDFDRFLADIEATTFKHQVLGAARQFNLPE